MPEINIAANFPPKCAGLFKPARYKVLYGGRGSAKSWSCARALVILCQQSKMRVLCLREYLASMADSVHQLLCDQIEALGMQDFYTIERNTIYGRNGSEIRFAGLRTNPSAIRSFESINVAWCEEAQSISKSSWDTLLPTIRAPNSEVWVTMNPELETDDSFKRWVLNPPKNAWVVKLNHNDNPFFPDVLREEMEACKEQSLEDWLHIWEGHCRTYLDGAVYYEQLATAEREGRIGRVPYDPMCAVDVFFDLGWADHTSLWFAQKIPGGEVHFIGFYENNRKPIDHYLKILSDKHYPINTVWLPHDARAKNLGTGKSIEEIVRSHGFHVRIVPHLSLTDGINALRQLFSNLWIDRERCADGLQSLRHYRFEVIADGAGGFKNLPVHDKWSHAADSARYCAVALKAPKEHRQIKYDHRPILPGSQTSWMSL